MVLGIGMIIVRDGSVPAWERSIFHAVNDLPSGCTDRCGRSSSSARWLVGPVVAIVAALLRRYRLAIAVLIATVAKLVLERVVKAMSSRQRPGTSIGNDVHLRGDVSATGESFVSGHAVLIAAIAGLVTPYLPGRWKIVPWIVVALVMVDAGVRRRPQSPRRRVRRRAWGWRSPGVINLFLGPRRRT